MWGRVWFKGFLLFSLGDKDRFKEFGLFLRGGNVRMFRLVGLAGRIRGRFLKLFFLVGIVGIFIVMIIGVLGLLGG